MTLQPDNYARYDAFVGFAESLDPATMVAIYLRFYPLLQQEYRAMGFPNAHFNDRVVEAIDDMLTAPEVTGPIRLTQPQVHYRFADPLLEKLSAGRKIMIRVGPAHAARIKQVLRALRAELVRRSGRPAEHQRPPGHAPSGRGRAVVLRARAQGHGQGCVPGSDG